jgi:hypothetical protein
MSMHFRALAVFDAGCFAAPGGGRQQQSQTGHCSSHSVMATYC